MRKQYKQKKRCCSICKPHKRGWEKRWSVSDKKRQEAAQHEQDAHR